MSADAVRYAMVPAADADNDGVLSHLIGDRVRVAPEFQSFGIEPLCQQLSLTDQQQMSATVIHRRYIRIEQPLRVGSIKLSDIDPACLRAAVDEVEEVPAVGKELRE